MPLHDGEMKRITRGQPFGRQQDIFCTLDIAALYREYLVDYAQQRLEGRLDCVQTFDGGVPMKYFLQHLGVRYQSLAIGDTPLHDLL